MTRIYGPSATAGTPTYLVAVCQVCGVQWQVRSESGADAKGCAFCGAPEEAITIVSEAPDSSGAVVSG